MDFLCSSFTREGYNSETSYCPEMLGAPENLASNDVFANMLAWAAIF
jgi:hypothetical protein